ncbi:MAG: DUF2235 domain-containing protein [Methylotenera sp.]
MAKNIIFCADGTWNNPDDEVLQGKIADPPSNVFKLFNHLEGRMTSNTKVTDITGQILEREKRTADPTTQVAKYINGVGNANNKIQEMIGGGFGAGLIKRIVRGYTFISRNYEAGDRIYIIGFSRGAYTARALGGLIASQGLLANKFERGAEESYKLGAQAWYQYRKIGAEKRNVFATLAEAMQDLPSFIKSGKIKEEDFARNVPIAAIAVWDTVGALGIPEYDAQNNTISDAFRFADEVLSSKVAQGLHAVAIDEQRLLFTPTLWNKAAHVKQLVFPGAHSDVGGGYAETGLSDGALKWMVDELKLAGVLFAETIANIKPDATAPAHKPWAKLTKVTGGVGVRKFKLDSGIVAHSSVTERRNATGVLHDIGEAAKKYLPSNWLN